MFWQTLAVAWTNLIGKNLLLPVSPADISQPARSRLGFRQTSMIVTIESIDRARFDDAV